MSLAYGAASSKIPWRVVFNVSSSASMSTPPSVVRYLFWKACQAVSMDANASVQKRESSETGGRYALSARSLSMTRSNN